jgi:hypothetical protein
MMMEGGGGDVGFIIDIMKDSQFFRHHVTWYTSLVCKKSSLDTIQHQLLTLNGVWGNRGQIRKVEFRQENFVDDSSNLIIATDEGEDPTRTKSRRVRWGIGWTYERAIGRCSVCRVNEGVQSFVVWINVDNDDASEDDQASKCAEDEVLSRLSTFFESRCDISLKCELGRRLHNDKLMRCVTVVEKRFYNNNKATRSASKMTIVPSHEHDNINLPIEGHFLIDAFVESRGKKCNSSGSYGVQVKLDMYSHTKHGSAIINMLQNQLPGEICLTNRKWRRFLQRKRE